MGTITQVATTVADDGIVPSSGWFTGTQVTAKVYINSIYAVLNCKATNPGASGIIPLKRFRMSVTNGGIIQNNIVEAAYRAYFIDPTSPLAENRFFQGVNPDNGQKLDYGDLALEMVGGCGNNAFEYMAGSIIGVGTTDIAGMYQTVLGVLMSNTTLTGTAKINVIAHYKDTGNNLISGSLMFISYHVPEYFYLNKNDVLKCHSHKGGARLLLTVVTE